MDWVSGIGCGAGDWVLWIGNCVSGSKGSYRERLKGFSVFALCYSIIFTYSRQAFSSNTNKYIFPISLSAGHYAYTSHILHLPDICCIFSLCLILISQCPLSIPQCSLPISQCPLPIPQQLKMVRAIIHHGCFSITLGTEEIELLNKDNW